MERRAIAIEGIVQGVGFRPFVHGLASHWRLAGSVKNRNGAVLIEIEGDPAALDAFLEQLSAAPPPLATITDLQWQRRPLRGDNDFLIESSERGRAGPVFVAPDVAVCAACLAEMRDPGNRRHRYPFLNCTDCGPRLSIVQAAPYDRQRTTMASFRMCAACQAEYDDPGNRRFHAQPTACAQCGPVLTFLDGTGRQIAADDPLAQFAAVLREGGIVALKGLGGYHLACDARRQQSVGELRRRKRRDEKPFALMLKDVAAVEEHCEISPAERELLQSAAAPIVLLRRREAAAPARDRICDDVAPGNPFLGVMLPSTPLHHSLLEQVAGMPLVMTSGNRSDEPSAYDDRDAVQRLAGIADVFLVHNRPIHVRCDDSLTRIVDGIELPLRRSRGYAPQPVALPFACPRPMLAVGGQFKGTFALGRDRHAVLSHHLGDLDHLEAYQAFERDVDLYLQLFEVTPAAIAHDMHPDYASTHYAKRSAQNHGVALVAVQHHHAHFAACLAEHGLTQPAIGVIFDGTGYGLDGAIWGGEFLVGDYRQFERRAHFRYVGLPGAAQAIREPWRMALAHLQDAETSCPLLERRLPSQEIRIVRQMLERRFNTPSTSSVGRLFDAVAALAGVRDRVSFEGQAAMELEWLATRQPAADAYPFEVQESSGPLIVDTRPLIRNVAQDVSAGEEPARIARRFHSTMVEIIADVCCRLRLATGLQQVVLSGGVFMNALLTTEATARLRRAGFEVFRHRLVPPNDGGLSLGQLAVAAQQLRDV